MSPSLSPCLSQNFGRCTLRPSSGGWSVELNPLFRLLGCLFLFYEPCLMDISYQLSSVNFPTENSPLISPGIEFTLFGYVTRSNQCLYNNNNNNNNNTNWYIHKPETVILCKTHNRSSFHGILRILLSIGLFYFFLFFCMARKKLYH